MSITSRERMLLHWIIKKYDHATGSAAITATDLEMEAGVTPADFAVVVTSLLGEDYLQEATLSEDDGTWRLVPSDRGVLTAMGLAE